VEGRRKLPVGKILLGAFVYPWWARRAFAKALAVPAALIAVSHVLMFMFAQQLPYALLWVAFVGVWALWAVYAVICHRLILLQQQPADVAVIPRWTRRETVFCAWLLLTGLMDWVLTMLSTIVAAALPMSGGSLDIQAWAGWIISGTLGTYVAARLAPVFPAAAVDNGIGLAAAWRLTRNNGWRMAVAIGALPWALTFAMRFIYRDESSILQVVLVVALSTILLAVEIAALSLAYRELISAADAPS
jgi:hypothetical protein